MKKALLLLLVLAAPIQAQTVRLPAELKGSPGIPIPIVAEADGVNVTWMTPDKGLVCVDGGFFGGDSKRAMLFGPQGMYRVWAITAKGDRVSPLAECRVTIGEPGPGPGPDPGPEPEPTDALWLPLKQAWLAEPTATRKADRDQLANLYQEGLSYLKADRFAKPSELNAVLAKARATVIGERLAGVRAILNAESQRILPSAVDAVFDAASKDAAIYAFTRYVVLLKRLP